MVLNKMIVIIKFKLNIEIKKLKAVYHSLLTTLALLKILWSLPEERAKFSDFFDHANLSGF